MNDKKIIEIERYYTDLKNAIAIPTNDIEFLSRLNSSIKESNSSCMEDLLRPVSSWTTFFRYAYCPVINYFYVVLRYGLFDEDSLSLLDRFFPRRIKYRAAEIFDIISKVSKENAMFIIDRMSETSDIYESLCEAYENNDETAFVEVITNNKLDTSKIKNICYLFSGFDHNSQKVTSIDLKKIIYTGIPLLTLSEHRTLEYQLSQIQESTVGTKKLYSVTLEIQNSLKKIDALFRRIPDVVKFDGDGKIVNISGYNEFVANWGNEWSRYENGFVAIAKKMFYILLKEDPQFSYQEQEIFDEMVTRPEVAEYFIQWKDEYLTFNSEEQNAKDEGIKEKKSGRKLGCWLKGKSRSDENRWAINIETKVWDKALEQARSLDYGKLTEFEAKREYAYMSAALIFKAAEIIGIAESWGNGVQSSFERTMGFTEKYQVKIDRRYMPEYLELLDNYLMAKEFQVRGNQELFNRHEYTENFYEEDESEYAASTYKIHSKHIFPSNNEVKQMKQMRDELLDEYKERNKPKYDFLLKNFKSIGTALSIVKQTIKKIR